MCNLSACRRAYLVSKWQPGNRRGCELDLPMSNRLVNITRIDIGDPPHGTHAWEVRIRRRGKRIEKTFSDSPFGGKKKALAAAAQFRDKALKQMKPYSKAELLRIPNSDNKSGIRGVRLKENFIKKNDRTYRYVAWEAMWCPKGDGRPKKLAFSVARYGNEKALRLAIAARKKGISEAAKNAVGRGKGSKG